MFHGPLPDVPTLFVSASSVLYGGGSISATGIGSTPAEAKLRHDGERAERIAQSRLQEPGVLPAPQQIPPIAGLAAGRDGMAQVQARAVLELIERWTCLSWWAGTLAAGKPDQRTQAAFKTASKTWRRRSPRQTGLLQLGQPQLPPTCVAWSCDPSGRSLCFGTACGMDGAQASTAALRELYQMEFGLSVIRHRLAGGVKLSASEQRILKRAESLTAETMTRHFQAGEHPENRFDGDLYAALADTGIALSVTQTADPVDGHRVVIATSADLGVVPPIENQCNTALRWNLYGA